MIKNWIVTGDTHGGMSAISRVGNIHRNMEDCVPEYTGIIILGDAGLNFYLNGTDKKYKNTRYQINLSNCNLSTNAINL